MAEVTKAQANMWDAYRKFEGAQVEDKNRKSIHTGGFTPEHIIKMKESIFKHSIQNGETGKYVKENFTQMIKILQDKSSPGGDSITPEEQTTLYEFMLNITGHEYKYSN